MSIKLLAAELSRFFDSTDPEVLCITGKWGGGKTYAWNYYLRQAQVNNNIKLKRYAYVSLFGRNSLDDVRTAVVENTVTSGVAGKKPDLRSFRAAVDELRSVGGTLSKFASFIPGAAAYVGSLNRALFLTVRDQIVCIDDLERMAPGLDMMNVLGLVSSLKEEKSCKVVIILNQDALSGESEKKFKAQLEKVADTIMTFDPTPSEAAEIGIDRTTKFQSWLSENTQALGIVNIRVIKRIETFCHRVQNIVVDNDERILKQAVHTLTLAAYCKFQPDEAPPLEFVTKYNQVTELVGPEQDNEEQNSRFKSVLRDYNFHHLDEFDVPLIEGIERGFFDQAAVKSQADEVEKRLKLGGQNTAFEDAWRLFHDSFDNDADAVLDAMIESAKANVLAISPLNLNGTVAFLKEFGRAKQALELIRLYVDSREEKPGFWDLPDHPFLNETTIDPDVGDAFRKKLAMVAVTPDREEILKRLGDRGAWNPEDLERLANLTEANYVDIFKRLRDGDRRKVLKGGLIFRTASNPDERMKSITRMAEGALRQIASESPMNAKRVRNLGVQIQDSGS